MRIANISNAGTSTSAPSGGSEPVVMRLRLIGQMEAWSLNSESVLPAGRKTRALLAMVALAAPRPALRGRLAEMLWSRRPEEQARASLRQEIHRLLETLSIIGTEVLTVTRDHLAMRPGLTWTDVDEVLRATTRHPQSLSLLDGELLEGLDGIDPAFDAWLMAERERLRDRARAVAEALLQEQLEPEAAIPAAQQLLNIDRAHEGAWRAIMQAHAARGERGMAIQAYERCRAVLADLLDVTPSPETQRLLGEIRNSKTNGLTVPPPAPPPAAASPGAPASQPPAAEEIAPARPPVTRGGARVGVLPLQLLGGAEDEDLHLAGGLAEELTAALARFRWMFLVSSTSLARYAEQTRDETAIRRTFGLDFLLDGTIQRARTRLRITLRLLDLRAGNQVVWARRFDRQAHDLLTLQDEIAAEVVAQIDPEILLIEAQRAAHRPPQDATAYDLVLRALPLMQRMSREDFVEAGRHLARAVYLEPDYAAAYAWQAYWHIFWVGQGWAAEPALEQHSAPPPPRHHLPAPGDAPRASFYDDGRTAHPAATAPAVLPTPSGAEALLTNAGRLAERAIMLDSQDAKALTIAGHVRAFLHRRLREAVVLHERALTLNPNLSMAWAMSAFTFVYLGELDEADRRAARYKRLSPMDPHSFFFDVNFIFIALLRGDFEGAVAAGREVTEMNPSFSAAIRPYLAALGHLGQKAESEAVLARLMALEPDFTVEQFLASNPFQREEDQEVVAQGLRLAGVAEYGPGGGRGQRELRRLQA